ncbi:glycosidase [Patescibacteria group bacterium]|nr:glycosidase [Patescibacteria group bacterium]
MPVFKRHPENPLIKLNLKHYWEDEAVFNPGVTYFNNKFIMLYRAIGEYDHYISFVGLATSEDGVHFERQEKPLLQPERVYEQHGIEDLRINPLKGDFYLTYTALSQPATQGGEPHQVGLIKTKNFTEFERIGVITPKEFCSRNAVLFPEKINGDYIMIHRPLYLTKERYPKNEYYPAEPGIWISYSKNLIDWVNHQLLMESWFPWENFKIGGGPPPVKTERGWLLIYHGVDQSRYYRAGVALLDLNDPRKIIARSRQPILEPEEEYERKGDVPNVVFPTGLILKDNTLYLYYGAADKTCCLATVPLTVFLDSIV